MTINDMCYLRNGVDGMATTGSKRNARRQVGDTASHVNVNLFLMGGNLTGEFCWVTAKDAKAWPTRHICIFYMHALQPCMLLRGFPIFCVLHAYNLSSAHNLYIPYLDSQVRF
jgi:hypothetical protein